MRNAHVEFMKKKKERINKDKKISKMKREKIYEKKSSVDMRGTSKR